MHCVGSKFAHFTRVHPCFNHDAHFKYARIHLPVAPKCNIQCAYCSRGLNKCEYRPGVASAILTVEEAVEMVRRAYTNFGDKLKVVGVAGPGEPLFNRETFSVFKIVDEEFPFLVKCLASNGLLLEEKASQLADLNVRTVTVTVNALDPEVGAKIYEFVLLGGKVLRGVKAANVLIDRQLRGIERAVDEGLLVKVNFVIIPEVNASEVEKVAKKVAELGAIMMNIIPLIPLYRMSHLRPPTCEELNKARSLAERYLPVFRLCKQCRADSCGIPGLEARTPSSHFHG